MLSFPRAPKATAAARPLHAALRRLASVPLVATLVAFACREEVPLGAWGQTGGAAGTPSSSGGGSSGGGNSGGSNEPGSGAGGEGNATCARIGTPGPLNAGTAEIGPTLTATEWSWAARSDVMEVDLTVEDEPPPGGDGYFWAYQFGIGSSTQSNSGFVGLQVNGAFTNPDTKITDYTKRLAVFWISGPPLRAAFEDIVEPQAYSYTATNFNTMWLAINVIYPWEKCRTYRLRVGRHSVENGDIWYGAWVTDTVTQVRTFIGRILVPGSWGQLSRTSTSWCDRIGWAPINSCSSLSHVSATWGIPKATVTATGATSVATGEDRFAWNGAPLRCPSSRFTDFTDGVRHESGVGP